MARVFAVRELSRHIFAFVYPPRTVVGMKFKVVGGNRADRFRGRVFQIDLIRFCQDLGFIVVSESRVRCNRGAFHRVKLFFYPDADDRLQVVSRE